MRRLIIGAVILGGFWVYNQGYLDGILGSVAPDMVSNAGGDPVTEFAADDPEMDAAEAAARATLPTFLANTTDATGAGVDAAIIKVGFPIDGDDNSEVIWVGEFQQTSGTEFTGILYNQPNMMDGLNEGDTVSFTADMVHDWSFSTSDGTLYGNYSTRVMLPMLDAQTQEALGAMLSPDPVPADWN